MKGIRTSLLCFTASVVMAGTVPAQDALMWFNQGRSGDSTSGITWQKKLEPTLKLGSSLEMTGLIMDCLAPHQTWAMLTSSTAATSTQSAPPPSRLLILPAAAIGDPVVNHESTFVLLRLSFP
jgi:hypothetical protein